MKYEEISFNTAVKITNEIGTIIEAKYPIITTDGLPTVRQHELIVCETGDVGEVFELHANKIKIALFTNARPRIGTQVTRLNQQLIVEFHDGYFDAVHNPLGIQLIGKQKNPTDIIQRNIFISHNNLQNFKAIKQQCITGINIIDLVIPIGKGQRQLLIGDRKIGKRAVAIQITAAAVSQGMYVVYTLIGQNTKDIHDVYQQLKNLNAAEHTACIATTSAESSMLTYIAPFTAMAFAETLQERGYDVLVVLDDLTTHAQAYRELSLLAGRFPGRESYPGDIFYVHANLLERAGNYESILKKESSITALPIIHTNDSEIATYITTNSIGVTDGHLFFDKELYLKGIRPPIHMGLSVTRAGKQTQSKLMRDINTQVASFFVQYNKMQNYARFGGEASQQVKETLFQGELLTKFFTWTSAQEANIHIEILIFALIWFGYLKKENVNAMYTARKNLTYLYSKPDGKALITTLTQAESLENLHTELKKVEEFFLKICGLKK